MVQFPPRPQQGTADNLASNNTRACGVLGTPYVHVVLGQRATDRLASNNTRACDVQDTLCVHGVLGEARRHLRLAERQTESPDHTWLCSL